MGFILLFLRAPIRVVVGREGFARTIRRATERSGMTMIGETGGAEDGAAVEDRQDLLLGLRHLAIPELEVTTVLLFPILVEIDQNVDAPVELELVVLVEVGVDGKFAPGLNLVQPAPDIIGIGDNTLDARKRFEKLEQRAGVQKVKYIAHRRRQVLHHIKGQFSFIGIVELVPLQLLGLGKIPKSRFEGGRGQKIIEVNIGKGFVALILARLLLG